MVRVFITIVIHRTPLATCGFAGVNNFLIINRLYPNEYTLTNFWNWAFFLLVIIKKKIVVNLFGLKVSFLNKKAFICFIQFFDPSED